MGKNYMHIPAVGQIDPTLCWAACLSWWLKAAKNRKIDQSVLRDRHYQLWDDDGTMSNQGMTNLICDSRYNMTFDRYMIASQLTPNALQEHLDYGPVYIAYTETSTQKQHVNVIWFMSGTGNNRDLAVMEPEFQAINDGNGLPSGRFVGKHMKKNLNQFNQSGSVFIGSKMISV